MKFSAVVRRICVACATTSAIACVGASTLTAQAGPPLKYPPTARSAQGDDLNGVVVADPYRWLEAVSSPEVRAWVSAQNALTESFLARVPGAPGDSRPGRPRLGVSEVRRAVRRR